MSETSDIQPRRKAPGFRRRDAMHSWTLHFGPNMTPMVDVVMVILIFFMASAAFLGSEWFLKAAIPFEAGRGTSAAKPNDPLELPPARVEVVLDADANGATTVTYLGNTKVPLESFLAWADKLPRDETTRKLEVVLKPTARVSYRDVVRAHAACDAAGIFKVGIGVSRSPVAP
jgi:biopolymer transport protein ExbD